ncbi:MAG: hypothetical protein HIU91_07120 [Acidobacteria bacterium]|nr:hypothetical protein [Acidobacteriota bacterium]
MRCVLMLGMAAWKLLPRWRGVHLDTGALGAMTVFQPVAAFHTMDVATKATGVVMRPVALWLVPLAMVLWWLMGAVGRSLVLRRWDRALRARPMALLALGGLRIGLLAAVWAAWVWMMLWAGRTAITGRSGDPNVVLYCTIVICGSLALYVLWAIFSWPFQLAPLLAMERNLGAGAALGEALRSRSARGKLLEINLVMNIVKIAVLVLAMVFSASPLPFTEVATQTFLNTWWCGVILLYLAALDYFHVVRAVAYLRMWRALRPEAVLLP